MLTYEQLRDDPSVRKQFNQFNIKEKQYMFSKMETPQGLTDKDLPSLRRGLMMKTSEADSQVPMQPGTQTVNDMPMSWSKVGSEALSNLDDSAIEYGKNMWQALRHPIQTGQQLFGLMAGAVEKAIPGGEDKHAKILEDTVDFFKERYGGSNFGEVVNSIKHTMAEDPVGFLSDLSVVVTGGGASLLKGAQLGGKLAKVAGAGGKLNNVIKTAEKIRSITTKFDVADPLTALTKGVAKGTSTAIKGFATTAKTNQRFNSAMQKVLGVDGNLPDNRSFSQAAIERGVNMTENDMKRAAKNRNNLGKAIEDGMKKAGHEGGQLTHKTAIAQAFDNVINDASRFKIEGVNNPAYTQQLIKMKADFLAARPDQLTALDLQKMSKGIKFDAEIVDKFTGPVNKVNAEIKSIISTTLSDMFPEAMKGEGKKFKKRFTKKRKDKDLSAPHVDEDVLGRFGWKSISDEFGIQKQLDEHITADIKKHESTTTSGAKGILVGGTSNVLVGIGAAGAGFGLGGIPGAIGFTVAAYYISKFFDNPTMKAKFARAVAKQRNIRISAAKKIVDQRFTEYMSELQKGAQQAGRVSNQTQEVQQ